TGGTADRNRSHWSTSKTPSYTKSVSWQHHPTRDAKLQRIMDFITTAERADDNVAIRLPGHEFTKLLDDNRRHGITIDDSVWAKIQAL
ncbi:hypothetical protein ACS4Z7_19695, partial [Salmonella enterica]